ncbi:MAG: Flp pilus assembly protein CpaB [Moorellales bacterium]
MRFSLGEMGGMFGRRWPLLLAAAVGILVAAFAAKQMIVFVNTHRETVQVPVPARDIPPYAIISETDLEWREIVKGGEEPGAVRDPSEAIGKVALAPLYRGEQIRRERLGDAGSIVGRRVVALNVDVARSVGGMLAPGDLVDVWWVVEGLPPEAGWHLAAADAVLVDLKDSAGRSVLARERARLLQQQPEQQTAPAVAVVAVKAEEVSKVVGGALPRSANIVLVKKFRPDQSWLPPHS